MTGSVSAYLTSTDPRVGRRLATQDWAGMSSCGLLASRAASAHCEGPGRRWPLAVARLTLRGRRLRCLRLLIDLLGQGVDLSLQRREVELVLVDILDVVVSHEIDDAREQTQIFVSLRVVTGFRHTDDAEGEHCCRHSAGERKKGTRVTMLEYGPPSGAGTLRPVEWRRLVFSTGRRVVVVAPPDTPSIHRAQRAQSQNTQSGAHTP